MQDDQCSHGAEVSVSAEEGIAGTWRGEGIAAMPSSPCPAKGAQLTVPSSPSHTPGTAGQSLELQPAAAGVGTRISVSNPF